MEEFSDPQSEKPMTFSSLRSWSVAAIVVCLMAAHGATCAHAQQNSLFGSSGPASGSTGFGTATTGSTLGSAAGGAQGTGLPTSAFPTSGFPAGGTAGAAAGQGMTGMAGQQRTGLVGQTNNRFVGMAAAGQNPQQQNQTTNRQGQNRNNTNRRQGQNQNQANQAGAGAGNQQRSIRPQLVVAFDHPRPTVKTTETALNERFQKLSNRAGFEGITVEGEGSKVILRGEVDSAETSRKATMLSRLQPGVRSVQNELTIKAKPSPAE